MNKLKKQRRAKSRRLHQLQRVRHLLKQPKKAARKRGLKGVANRIHNRVSEWLSRRIKEVHRDLNRIEREIERRQQQETHAADKLYAWAKSNLGVRQGSAEWASWMRLVGGYDPWCSFFVGAGLIEAAGFTRSQLP